MTLGELFAGIANAIRSKDGTTDRIPSLTFPERILALSGGGGGGGDLTARVATKMFDEPTASVIIENYSGFYLFNGYRLPEIPSDATSYWHLLIARSNAGAIRIYGSTSAIYWRIDTSDENHEKIRVPGNRIRLTLDAGTNTWGAKETATSATNLDLTDTWEVLWSNKDILKENTSDVYFEGTVAYPIA